MVWDPVKFSLFVVRCWFSDWFHLSNNLFKPFSENVLHSNHSVLLRQQSCTVFLLLRAVGSHKARWDRSPCLPSHLASVSFTSASLPPGISYEFSACVLACFSKHIRLCISLPWHDCILFGAFGCHCFLLHVCFSPDPERLLWGNASPAGPHLWPSNSRKRQKKPKSDPQGTIPRQGI